jgi:hypothetical protein
MEAMTKEGRMTKTVGSDLRRRVHNAGSQKLAALP